MSRKTHDQKFQCQFFSWTLFPRGQTWYADGRANVPSLGKHSLGVTEHDQAMEELRRLDRRMAERHNLVQPVAYEHDEVPLTEGWDAFERHVSRPDVIGGAGTKTQARYRAVREKHEPFCQERGIKNWNNINKREIVAYGDYLAKKSYADATVYLELTVLKQILKFLIEEEHVLPESARVSLQLRRSHESNTFCPTREQVEAILGFCRSDPKLHWLVDVISALCTTGMRISELCALRWSDADLSTGMISVQDTRHSARHQRQGAVRRTKGRRSRRIPIHRALRASLEVLAHETDGRVFHGPRLGRLKPDTVLSVLKREVIQPLTDKFPTPDGEVGFADCRVHSFRHFFVSQAFIGGASEGEIREWVGHTDSRVIERYRHLGTDDAKRKMNRLSFFDEQGNTNGEAKTGDCKNKNQEAGASEQSDAAESTPQTSE